jgi:hypothetical protein
MSQGISPNLQQRLITTLLQCGPLANQGELQPIFTDDRIAPWASQLPEGHNAQQRAEALVHLLHNKYHTLTNQNALISLLHVLTDRHSPATNCYQDLRTLAQDLTKLLNKSVLDMPPQNTDWAGYLLDYSLSRRNKFEEVKHICMDCIESLDLQPLLIALNHPNKHIRKFAAKALGEIGSRFDISEILIVSALISTVKASEQEVETKRRAVWALGAIRPSHPEAREKTREMLRSLLIRNSDTPIRWRSAWGLGELKANEEDSILAHFANNLDTHIDVRRAAVRSLGVLKASQYRKKIIEIVKNNHGNKLGQIAVWSLCEIDGTSN